MGEVSAIGLNLAKEVFQAHGADASGPRLGGAAVDDGALRPNRGRVDLSVIDDPARFAKSRSVGAYLGLTPRRYQSGEVGHSGRMSKCDDAPLRSYLFEVAGVILNRVTRWSAPKGVGEGLGHPDWSRRSTARRPPLRSPASWRSSSIGCGVTPERSARRRKARQHEIAEQ